MALLRFMFLTGCAALALAGCQQPSPKLPPAAEAPGDVPAQAATARGVRLVTHDGAFVVRYACNPAPPPANEPFAITVLVAALDGSTPRDLALSVDAAMPEHGHGMNVEPVVRLLAPGSFAVENMLFHMSGRWEIYFDVTCEGVTTRAQDEIVIQ